MIVSNNQVQNVLKVYAKQAHKVNKEKTVEKAKSDLFVLSREAKELQNMENKIKAAIEQTPEIRVERVKELKKMMAEGKYDVSSMMIAEKMLSRSLVDDILKD